MRFYNNKKEKSTMRFYNKMLFMTLVLSVILMTGFGCSDSSSKGGSNPDIIAPTVLSTVPADNATSVARNSNITATFNEEMDPDTITAATFTLMNGATPVTGVVTYTGTTAALNPASILAATTEYTATITTGVTDLAGNALAVKKTWSFTTSAIADTTAPTVVSTLPDTGDSDVAINANITATFSEAMDASTIDGTTTVFTLTHGTPAVSVAGAVSYAGLIATFNPTADLDNDIEYTATITTAVKDLADNALAVNKTWTFTTIAAVPTVESVCTTGGADCVPLLTAGNFAILANTGITDIPTSDITGDIGNGGTSSQIAVTCSEMADGTIYGIDAAYTGDGDITCYINNATIVGSAAADVITAYNNGANASLHPSSGGSYINVGSGTIIATTALPAGVYDWNTDVNITENITLTGSATDVWIFRTTGNLVMATSTTITLAGGAQASHIFWVVDGASVTIQTGSHLEGVLLGSSDTTIVMQSGSSVDGRLLGQVEVTLAATTVTQP